MKTLYIIRHSKSDWKSGEKDFDRGLNKRGEFEAKELGEFFKENSISPDLIISSAAKRTVLTSESIAREINYPISKVQKEKGIYEAFYEQYLPVIWGVDNGIETLAIVGHNPGVANLVYALTGEYFEFKTSCYAQISFETRQWENVFPNEGELKNFYVPKNELVF